MTGLDLAAGHPHSPQQPHPHLLLFPTITFPPTTFTFRDPGWSSSWGCSCFASTIYVTLNVPTPGTQTQKLYDAAWFTPHHTFLKHLLALFMDVSTIKTHVSWISRSADIAVQLPCTLAPPQHDTRGPRVYPRVEPSPLCARLQPRQPAALPSNLHLSRAAACRADVLAGHRGGIHHRVLRHLQPQAPGGDQPLPHSPLLRLSQQLLVRPGVCHSRGRRGTPPPPELRQ